MGMPRGQLRPRCERLNEVLVQVAAEVGRVIRVDRRAQAGIAQRRQLVLRIVG